MTDQIRKLKKASPHEKLMRDPPQDNSLEKHVKINNISGTPADSSDDRNRSSSGHPSGVRRQQRPGEGKWVSQHALPARRSTNKVPEGATESLPGTLSILCEGKICESCGV